MTMNICEFMDGGVIRELKEKNILHWNYQGLLQLPVEILYHGMHIEEIYLKSNDIQQLPAWVDKLNCLRNLYLYGNRISKLPETIGGMTSLTVLELQNNCLTELTPSIGDLKLLKALDLQYNYIEKIPKEINKLKYLTYLNLKGNKLRHVCEEVCSLRSLMDLILDGNKISFLPNNIVYLPNLSFLSLDGNFLKYLPFVCFINKPLLSIINNKYLNYVSYDLGKMMTSHSNMLINEIYWYFNCHGCFKQTVDSTRMNILEIPSFNTRIILPPSLKKVYDNSTKLVPSLLETTLRTVYTFYFYINELGEGMYGCNIEDLPIDLTSYFFAGPVAECQYCKVAIFTEAILWVFPRQMFYINPESPKSFFATMFFCGQNCIRRFREEERINVELINWNTS